MCLLAIFLDIYQASLAVLWGAELAVEGLSVTIAPNAMANGVW